MVHRRLATNPWLTIPACDYEGHMNDPSVNQSRILGDLLAALVERYEPSTIALLGCATGNGCDRLVGRSIRRIIGIDIQMEYLRLARRRYASRIPALDLVCADLSDCELREGSLDFAYAALILEYVNPLIVIEKCSRWLRDNGTLAVVSQLPSDECGKVSQTSYESLRRLEPFMRLLHPGELDFLARRNHFRPVRSRTHRLESGKEFFEGVFRLESKPPQDSVDCRPASKVDQRRND